MDSFDVTRRAVLAGAAGLLAAALPGPASATPARLRLPAPIGAAGLPGMAMGASAGLRLPAPTGRFPVGTRRLHLVEATRPDPLAPQPRPRELMVTLWYPAQGSGPAAGYLTPGVSTLLVEQLNALIGSAYPQDLLTFATAARQGAAPRPGPHPVVLFSPGLNTNVAFYTGLCQDLASRGFKVIGVDHTYDGLVEFPDGRIELPAEDPSPETLLAVRVADMGFVRARLADRCAVAAMGHSLGSMTVIGALEQDSRFTTGVAMDGNPLGEASLTQPFLMMGNPSHSRATDPDWAGFYDRLRGARLHLVVHGSEHYDFSDFTVFKQQIDLGGVFELGPIDGRRAMTIGRSYLGAWLVQTLLGGQEPLLRHESPAFPEVDFQP
ncbi:hypothetical protein Rhe02_60520 [Rhizocola hellebori]|uniref:Alpha/beta hydrolase n=1 Tax=Rhizocola hellebori TaxID=1392758 RepID=A0A8J3QE74_9ACTN|nr:hypothetical protein [Rhizocola hellebori]GIH07985.1 hypothetical protein Rhe02_60520 [Rhizocola hellebori]